MPFPNPDTQFKPGQSGNPGGRPRRRQTDDLLALIAETGASRTISKVWLKAILEGDFRFLREYLDRFEGKVSEAKENPAEDDQTSLRDAISTAKAKREAARRRTGRRAGPGRRVRGDGAE